MRRLLLRLAIFAAGFPGFVCLGSCFYAKYLVAQPRFSLSTGSVIADVITGIFLVGAGSCSFVMAIRAGCEIQTFQQQRKPIFVEA